MIVTLYVICDNGNFHRVTIDMRNDILREHGFSTGCALSRANASAQSDTDAGDERYRTDSDNRTSDRACRHHNGAVTAKTPATRFTNAGNGSSIMRVKETCQAL